jgi:hypothetical protein
MKNLFYLFFLAFCFAACEKDPAPLKPETAAYTLYVRNDYNTLEDRFAVFLSDSEGKLRAFRWIPARDTAQVVIPGARIDERFDCTVTRLQVISSGAGVRDTTVFMSTYTQVIHGEQINLRNLEFRQSIDLKLTLTGIQSLDSIIVPDGLTFIKPQRSNNFSGQFRVLHTGNLWIRVRINGEDNWRFLWFEKVQGPELVVNVDPKLWTILFAKPFRVNLPFTAPWQYKVEGILDTAKRQFVPMGDLLRAPGGVIPVFNQLVVFEPNGNDEFQPFPKPYQSFRLSINGAATPPGYGLWVDKIYAPKLPASLPEPGFDIDRTTLADNRSVGVQCFGDFDVLRITRKNSGKPRVSWEVIQKPANGLVISRLPDVPAELNRLIQPLQNYNFGPGVQVRAEAYDQFTIYEAVVRQMLHNNDALWQAKAGLLGREEVY